MPDDSVVQELVESFDLLAVVEGLVDLRKQGHWYIGPCPVCGGNDRFNLQQTPHGWRWHCRKCASGKYYNSIHLMEKIWDLDFATTVERMAGERVSLTEEEKLAIELERIKRAQAELDQRVAEAEAKLAELRNAKAWVRYHENLTNITRQLWEYRGVPDFWQDWWQLGYDPNHRFWLTKQGCEHFSPTLTIPVFGHSFGDIRNIKHRLLSPPVETDERYRLEKSGLPPAVWTSNPEQPIKGPVFLAEGEIKAMVTAATYDDDRMLFMGLPGKTPGVELLATLKEADPVYLCLDPDATESDVSAISFAVGSSRLRRIQLPMKIDDAILQYKLDRNYLKGLIAGARKATV